MRTIDDKLVYERMDAVFAALPVGRLRPQAGADSHTAREDFAELVAELAQAHPADAVLVVARWRRDHGFPKFE